jgi:UTP--glucose-1-phosphate uridylyltransferase
MDIKKAIIPAAGLGTRFYPLTKVLPKELLPLSDKPMIDYAVQEVKKTGLSQVIFVIGENKKIIPDYFRKNQKLENFLAKNKERESSLNILKETDKRFENINFSVCQQPSPKGDGDAVFRAKNFIKKEGFAVLFPDDIIDCPIPALSQLIKIFHTAQKPVVGLKKIPKEKAFSYGMVSVEKIANKFYKIKEIKEKPSPNEGFSDLAIVGRYILTPEIFAYLKKAAPNKKNEIILAEALNAQIRDGKIVYGYELSGDWLESGKVIDWMKSNLYLSLKHPNYGPVLRKWLKQMK